MDSKDSEIRESIDEDERVESEGENEGEETKEEDNLLGRKKRREKGSEKRNDSGERNGSDLEIEIDDSRKSRLVPIPSHQGSESQMNQNRNNQRSSLNNSKSDKVKSNPQAPNPRPPVNSFDQAPNLQAPNFQHPVNPFNQAPNPQALNPQIIPVNSPVLNPQPRDQQANIIQINPHHCPQASDFHTPFLLKMMLIVIYIICFLMIIRDGGFDVGPITTNVIILTFINFMFMLIIMYEKQYK